MKFHRNTLAAALAIICAARVYAFAICIAGSQTGRTQAYHNCRNGLHLALKVPFGRLHCCRCCTTRSSRARHALFALAVVAPLRPLSAPRAAHCSAMAWQVRDRALPSTATQTQLAGACQPFPRAHAGVSRLSYDYEPRANLAEACMRQASSTCQMLNTEPRSARHRQRTSTADTPWHASSLWHKRPI